MKGFWQALESIPGPAAVAAEWETWVGDDVGAVRRAFLQPAGRVAKSYPCPQECGGAHRVVDHGDGRIVAVSESGNCEDLVLRAEDVVVYELSWTKLGRAVARALECEAKEDGMGLPGTRQVAAFGGGALPVVLTLQRDPWDFRSVVGQLAARLRGGFILLSPTNRFLDASVQELLGNAKAGFGDLESRLTLMPSGALHARQKAGELFAGLLPEKEAVLLESASQRVFRLFRELMSLGAHLKAPPGHVFDLMVFKGHAQNETARRCKCAPSLITKRAALIEAHFDMSIGKLRDFATILTDLNRSVRRERYAKKREGAPPEEPADQGDPDAEDGKEDAEGFLPEERHDTP